MDPEDVEALLGPYHERLRDELERRGGTVEKFIGDAVMALFGAPTAHEDDPERAVRACLAIRDWAIAEEGSRCGLPHTTGEALIRLDARPEAGEGMASGDVVNTAARLQSAAPVNGVIVDETTYRATRQRSTTARPSRSRRRGKRSRSRSGRRLEARARFGTEVLDHVAGELVGREREIDALWARVRSCARRALASARHARRRPRHRQESPPVRALAPRRRRAGAHDMASGTMPRVRRRHHALGARRDRQGPGRHPRGGRRRHRGREAAPCGRGDRGPCRRGLGRRSPTPSGRPRGRVRARWRARDRGLRGLAPLLRGARRRAAADPRLRGPPVGGRGPSRLRRSARRLGDRRAYARRLHGSTRASRAPAQLGRWQAQRVDRRARAALRGGDRPTDGGVARSLGAAGRRPADPARARGREPALRRAVRPAVPRARLGRRPATPRDAAGHHQRPSRRPARRREGAAPRRRRRRQGLLDRRARRRRRRHGADRPLTRAKGLPPETTPLVGAR